MQPACNVAVAHTFHACGQTPAVHIGVDVVGIGFGFIDVAVEAEREFVFDNRAAQNEPDALRCAFAAVLRLVGVIGHRTAEIVGDFFGNNIDHAAHRARAVTRRRRTADDADAFHRFHGHPVAVAARVAFAAHTHALRIARGNGFAVNQNQRVFGAHAADVDLPLVAALAGGGIAGQVHAGHGADELGQIVGGGAFFNIRAVDARHAELLLQFAFGGHVNRFQLFGRRRCAVCLGVQAA